MDNENEYDLLGEPDQDDYCPDCEQEWEFCGCDDTDDGQPSFQYEHDSSMASIGWGTDEDYGYYGDDFE